MAVTANQLMKKSNPGHKRRVRLGASTTLYENTVVIGKADGYAYSAVTPAATDRFAGIACDKYDNSSGSAGDVEGEVWTKGSFWVPLSGAAQGDVGEKLYASDNFTFTKTSTNNVLVGTIVDFDTGVVQVELDIQAA